MLLDDFRERPSIALYHMAFRILNEHEVMFLYRFERGECPKSFGVNIARMSGLPQSILEKAKQKSQEFNDKIHKMLGGSAK
jgi:DNA mismatch repair protein MSH6